MLLAAPATAAATRTARADDGTRFVVNGDRVRVELGSSVRLKRGARVQVRCGRRLEVLRAEKRLRGRAIAIRFDRDAEARSEWCQLRRRGDGRVDVTAAQLDAPPSPPPAPLVAGPGVRVAQADDDGGATFLLKASVLTVRFREPLGRDRLLFLGAFRLGPDEEDRVGFRKVAVAASQTSVTVDLGRDAASATSLLVEPDGDADLFTADLR